MGLDIQKFSWSEMVSNGNGKTSGTAFAGLVICLVGTLCFFLGCIDKMFISTSIDVISQSIVFVGIGSSLLGLRKYMDSKNSSQTEYPDPLPEQDSDELLKS
jgi:uncharacterized membrane-anchored protein